MFKTLQFQEREKERRKKIGQERVKHRASEL